MTVAGPVWRSPPLKRGHRSWAQRHRIGDPRSPLTSDAHVLKQPGIDVLANGHKHALAGMTRRAWRRHAGPDARRGSPIICGCVRRPSTRPSSPVSIASGAVNSSTSQPRPGRRRSRRPWAVMSPDATAVDNRHLFGTAAPDGRAVPWPRAAADDAHARPLPLGQAARQSPMARSILTQPTPRRALPRPEGELLIAVGASSQVGRHQGCRHQAGKFLCR